MRARKPPEGRELALDAAMESEQRVDGIVEAGRKVVDSCDEAYRCT